VAKKSFFCFCGRRANSGEKLVTRLERRCRLRSASLASSGSLKERRRVELLQVGGLVGEEREKKPEWNIGNIFQGRVAWGRTFWHIRLSNGKTGGGTGERKIRITRTKTCEQTKSKHREKDEKGGDQTVALGKMGSGGGLRPSIELLLSRSTVNTREF